MTSPKRPPWAYHGQLGFYVGPAMNHYRCMTCFIPQTRQERISDTIQFFPSKINFPIVSINEQLINALEQITSIIGSMDFIHLNKNLQINNDTTQALNFLYKLLQHMSQGYKNIPLSPATNFMTPPIIPILLPSMTPDVPLHDHPPTQHISPQTPRPTTTPSHADLLRVQLQTKLNQVC